MFEGPLTTRFKLSTLAYQTLMSSDVRAAAPFLEVEEEMTLTTDLLNDLDDGISPPLRSGAIMFVTRIFSLSHSFQQAVVQGCQYFESCLLKDATTKKKLI